MLESTSMKLSTLVAAGAVAAAPDPRAMALCVVASLVQPAISAVLAKRPRIPDFAAFITVAPLIPSRNHQRPAKEGAPYGVYRPPSLHEYCRACLRRRVIG